MATTKATTKYEDYLFRTSIYIPVVSVLVLWAIKIIELSFNWPLQKWGVFPREFFGLKGIFTYPLIHGNSTEKLLGDYAHIFSNSFPLLILGFILLFNYRKVAKNVLLMVYFGSGILLWLIGRPSYHIGASGVVYGLAFFIIFMGFFQRDARSIALAFVVILFNSGLLWGMLPWQIGNVSWEGHFSGAAVGILAAAIYYPLFPRNQKHWENEAIDDPSNAQENPYWVKDDTAISVQYNFVPTIKDKQPPKE